MAEFALVLPVLLFILFGIFAFAHYFFFYFVNSTSSREAVRYGTSTGLSNNGVTRYKDCAEIRNAGLGAGAMIGLSAADITVEYDHGPGTSIFGTCPVGGTGPDLESGDRVIVTVTINYEPIVPFPMLENNTLTSLSRRSIIY